jgi:hypothetical protein
MTEDLFHKRIKEILSTNRGPNDSPAQQFHDMFSSEVKNRSKKDWDEETAIQVMREFEWATGTQPKTIKFSEIEIKAIITQFLSDRGYEFIGIQEGTEQTPDNYIEGNNHKYLCEIKSPRLNLDLETGLYKFKTTHRKILDFIHTATKQFHSIDSKHELPRVLVFTSSHMQLNWKSFTDAIQGGVIDQKGNRSPDFSNTQVYKSTLPLLSGIDLYIWFQVSETGDKFYQVSYSINDKSLHKKECLALVSNLSKNKLSGMDNLISLALT